jgi:hypothetical protein
MYKQLIMDQSNEKKKPAIKNKVYEKWIETSHTYDADKAEQLRAALESEWKNYVFIDPKFNGTGSREFKTVDEITTSHEIHVQDLKGKMVVNFIWRTRGSYPRFNNELIKTQADTLFGSPMPPSIPTRTVVNDPVEINDETDEELKLDDDTISEISTVPSIPPLVRHGAERNLDHDPVLDEPDIEDEEHDVLYHEYQAHKAKVAENEKPNPKSKTKSKWINGDHATGFFVGALLMKLLLGANAPVCAKPKD